jgi:hypothetical protein
MNDYLCALPRGLDANPECQIKGSVLRAFFEGIGRDRFSSDMPPAMRELIEHPPLPSSWVPEVRASALIVYASRALFDSDESFVAHAHQTNVALLDSFAYRILFRLVGSKRLMQQSAARWGLFHRGTELQIVAEGQGHRGATLHLKAPPYHVPPALAKAYATAFRAALEISGEREVRFEIASLDPRTTEFRARWE